MKLTIKQRLFCKEYVVNGYNATQAALAVGYSEHSSKQIGTENIAKPLIKAYIAELMKETEKKLDLSRDWVANKLKLAAERGIPDEEAPIQVYDPRVGLSALSELNKMYGYYAKTDNSNQDKVDDEIKSAISKLEDDE